MSRNRSPVQVIRKWGDWKSVGLKWELWLHDGHHYLAEIYHDGVCQLFDATADGIKTTGHNLISHNMHGRSEAQQAIVKGGLNR